MLPRFYKALDYQQHENELAFLDLSMLLGEMKNCCNTFYSDYIYIFECFAVCHAFAFVWIYHAKNNPLQKPPEWSYSKWISHNEAFLIYSNNHTKAIININIYMMTSPNGNIFRVTGHLCGEFTGPRRITRTKASDAELWCFLWSVPE